MLRNVIGAVSSVASTRKRGKSRRTQVSVPAAKTSIVSSSKPSFNGRRSTVIRHSEPIALINGASAFNVNLFEYINPANQAIFPWLSTQAVCWEKYKFLRLHFEYVPRCPTSTAGFVALAIEYDPTDPAPVSELILSTYASYKESAPWNPLTISVDLSKLVNKLFFNRPLNPQSSVSQYDIGKLIVASNSVTPALGKLIAHYEVEFFEPQLPAAGSPNLKRLSGQLLTANASAPLGDNPTITGGLSGIDYSFTDHAPHGQVNFRNPGIYVVTIEVGGTTFAGWHLASVNGTMAAIAEDGGAAYLNYTFTNTVTDEEAETGSHLVFWYDSVSTITSSTVVVTYAGPA